MNNEHFYGKPIHPDDEQEKINALLNDFKNEAIDEKLLQKVHAKLMEERHLGNITIPFTIEIKKGSSGSKPDYLEIQLETKV